MFASLRRIKNRFVLARLKRTGAPGFPTTLQTERLILRAPEPKDADELHAAIAESIDNLRPWLHWATRVPTPAQCESLALGEQIKFLRRQGFTFHLYPCGANTLAGVVELSRIDRGVPKCMMTYWLRDCFAGQGYATEAVRAVLTFAFETLKMRRVWLQCDIRNDSSRRLAERCGFNQEGRLRNERRMPDGTLSDTLIYAMMLEEYCPKNR